MYTITTTEAKETYTIETYDEAIRIWEKLKHDIAQTIDSPPDAPARFLTTPLIAAYPWVMKSGCPIHVYTGGHSFAREFMQALQERPHQYQTDTLF